MAFSRAPYTLDKKQLEAALVALGKASEAFRPTRRERGLYRALGICAKIAMGTFVAVMVLVFLDQTGKSPISDSVVGLVVIGFLLSGGAAIVLLIANLALIRDTLRQRRLLRRLGLEEVSLSAWRARRRGRALAKIGGALLTAGGMLLLVFMFLWSIGTESPGPFEILFGVSPLFVGVTVLTWRFLQRSREQLEVVADAERLREALAAMKVDGPDQIVVPAEMFEKVAGIEQAQIVRERADAVAAGICAPERGFGILSTPEIAAQKAALSADLRLELEELIEQVAAQPETMTASGPDPEGRFSARIRDGGIGVVYSVDKRNRRVRILSVGTIDDNVNDRPSQDCHAH